MGVEFSGGQDRPSYPVPPSRLGADGLRHLGPISSTHEPTRAILRGRDSTPGISAPQASLTPAEPEKPRETSDTPPPTTKPADRGVIFETQAQEPAPASSPRRVRATGIVERFEFPPEVMREVAALPKLKAILTGREEVHGITIDPSTAKDLDDGLGVVTEPANTHTLQVSVSEVSAVVRPNTAIDVEAEARGFTGYRGSDTVTPMLPRPLSASRLSLLPGQTRPTLTLHVPFNDRDKTSITQTAFTSAGRMSPKEFSEILKDPSHPRFGEATLLSSVADALERDRSRKGSLVMYDSQSGLATDEDGNIIQVGQDMTGYKIVQEAKIKLNTAFGKYLARHGLPALYRNQHGLVRDPDSEDIRIIYQNAAMNKSGEPLDEVNDRLQVLYGRASFGVEPEGHMAMGVDAYAPGGIGLRLHASLVNQRIVIAHMRGEESPYTPDQLDKMARRLNSQTTNEKIHTKKFYVAESKREVARVQKQKDLGSVDPSLFTRVVRDTSRDGVIPENVGVEVQRRLIDGRLSVYDQYLILRGTVLEDGSVARLKSDVLAHIYENPQLAPQIVQLGEQRGVWSAPEFTTQEHGLAYEPQSTTSATMQIGDTPMTSDQITAHSQTKSEQLALWNVLSKISQSPVEDVSQDKYTTTDLRKKLKEMCKTKSWNPPNYEVTQEGPPDNPLFKVTASVTFGDVTLQSHEFTGSSRNQVETAAAKDVLKQARSHMPNREYENIIYSNVPRRDRPVHVNQGNYLEALQTLASRQGWEEPHYEITEVSGPERKFTCTVRITIPGEEPREYTVGGSSIKNIKKLAARKAFRNMSPQNSASE